MDAEAAVRAGADLERAAVESDAFAHPDEPVPNAIGRERGSIPVVTYVEFELVLAVVDVHIGTRWAGVLADVGQRLLNDSVGGEVDPRRQRPGGAVDRQVHGQARLSRLLDEAIDVRQPRLRMQRPALVARAQDAEHAPQL